jgi:hypothetical protein
VSVQLADTELVKLRVFAVSKVIPSRIQSQRLQLIRIISRRSQPRPSDWTLNDSNGKPTLAQPKASGEVAPIPDLPYAWTGRFGPFPAVLGVSSTLSDGWRESSLSTTYSLT